MIPVQIVDRNNNLFRTALPALPRRGDYTDFASPAGQSRVVVVDVVFVIQNEVFQFVQVQVW